MHKDPDPILHRDIRWPNVIKRADDSSKWFLIDWEDVDSPPTRAARHLDPVSHSPAVYEPNHGPEVDLWGVGQLIKDISKSIIGFPHELVELATVMQGGDVAAVQALEMLRSLQMRTMMPNSTASQGTDDPHQSLQGWD